jgi:hypothetical protein
MKRFTILALAALLVVAFTVPAAAFESQFGGYWRTRFYINKDFSGDDSGSRDWEVVDTRTRLYYTAVLNDNLKFVNKFEWNAVWGDPGSAPIGTDRTTVMRWKNSYIDANAMGLNWKIGLQGTSLGRSFLFDDDFAGAIVTYKSDMFDLPFLWIKAYDDGSYDSNTYDYDYYAINPKFKMGGVSLNPFALYAMTNNAANAVYSGGGAGLPTFDRLDTWFLGLNADFNVGPGSMWFTGIYNGGTGEIPGGNDQDFGGYLLAVGGNFDLGPANVHGQIFYASGDDDPNDNDIDAFVAPKGQSYYWSEIMGYGIFDKQVSNGSPGDQISNITAYNLGAGMKMSDKWKGSLDLWYANLTEDNALGDNDLGFEIDLVLTYQVIEGLNLDLVGAYLFAGDATTLKASNDQDPYEVGARLSLSF